MMLSVKNFSVVVFSCALFMAPLCGTFAQSKSKKPIKKEAQKVPPAQSVNVAEDEKKVKDIVAFLQYMLNTLGSSGTSARDKEVMATESYAKIFRDAKVQIEDDLDEDRIVVTNKDVVPYLKDVDFFFTDVKFEFAVEAIKASTLPNGEHFYKVSARRTLTGTTTQGVKIINTIPRYIEINYNAEAQDLKIASIYTHELNQTEALLNWWNELSLGWKTALLKKLPDHVAGDSMKINDLKKITAITELDLSGNKYVQNIEPLDRLLNLRSLNISATEVNDLTPIRNLAELTALDISHTTISNLSPLRYASKMTRLNCRHTFVRDISIVEKMPLMQDLDLSKTGVVDFSVVSTLAHLQRANFANTKLWTVTPLDSLVELTYLNLASTDVQDLSQLTNLSKLRELTIDSTHINSIDVLTNFKSLEVLQANYTPIGSLMPLQSLSHLQKIYADNSGIDRAAAKRFNTVNPNVRIIFDSEDLKNWWNALSPTWKKIFIDAAHITTNPSKEEMAKVSHLDSVNISGNKQVSSLAPLANLQKLEVLILNNTAVLDLAPLATHMDIEYLDISFTAIHDLSLIKKFSKLRILRADSSKIDNIDSFTLPSLRLVYADNTLIQDPLATEFLKRNPQCVIVYKSQHLKSWWGNLSDDWKTVFTKQMNGDTTITREYLHALVELQAVKFNDIRVHDLSVINEFVRLKNLQFSGTAITTIPSLPNLRSLRSLLIANNPLHDIDAINKFDSLEVLDISNTPVEDLDPLSGLQQLTKINCSGTQIKRLDPLDEVYSLKILDCSNTRVKKLDPLAELTLKEVTCYNTRISSKRVEQFKDQHPGVNVIYYR